jgi:hypothetical protein
VTTSSTTAAPYQDCVMKNWGPWTNCSEACGGGVKERRRQPLLPQIGAGDACAKSRDYENCNTSPCADCEYDWQDWSTCTQSCGGGHQIRRVTVHVSAQNEDLSYGSFQYTDTDEEAGDIPASHWQYAANGGDCALAQQRVCNSQPCPEDCKYEKWGKWGQCSETCGVKGEVGFQTRSRDRKMCGGALCEPSYGGKSCTGLTQQRRCNN